MRKLLLVVPIVMLGVGSTACATKKFVRGEVGQVSSKVDTLGRRSNRRRSALGRTKARIGEVDTRPAPRSTAIARARRAADTKASGDGRHGGDASRSGRQATNRVCLRSRPERGPGQLQVRQDRPARTRQGSGSTRWSPAQGRPEGRVLRDRRPHGQRRRRIYNEKLGMERAEAVKRYLYEQHQIPLHRMNVISYGEDKPVATTRPRTAARRTAAS